MRQSCGIQSGECLIEIGISGAKHFNQQSRGNVTRTQFLGCRECNVHGVMVVGIMPVLNKHVNQLTMLLTKIAHTIHVLYTHGWQSTVICHSRDVKYTALTFRIWHSQTKCIVMTAVCLSVCLSLAALPQCNTNPDVTWGTGRGCPLVVHYWADLQSVHRFRCYGNRCA